MTPSTSKTFCPLPFMHTYVTADGAMVSCCEAQETKLGDGKNFLTDWNSSPYRELRRALLSDERPQACTKCWRNEDQGIFSNRQQALRELPTGFYGEQPLTSITTGLDELPVSIELKCNNLCNLKCRMCHPESSHRIGEDREIISKYRKNLTWNEKSLSSAATVEQILNLDPRHLERIRHVQFSGGEPLISREQYDLVKKLLSHHPENIHLRYATNLSHLRFEDFEYVDIWKRFKKVNVKVSADGIHDVYEYIRVGAKFDNLVNNLKKLLDKKPDNVSVNIGFTTQAYNVFQLPEFFAYFENILGPHQVHQYPLHAPWFMGIGVIPEEYRPALVKKLGARVDFAPLTKLLENSPADPKAWTTLLNYTSDMEQKYGIKDGFLNLLQKYLH